jgi:hypothetical protein
VKVCVVLAVPVVHVCESEGMRGVGSTCSPCMRE